MRDLAVERQNECEHVYTTAPGCVAAETRLGRQLSTLQRLTADLVGQRIAIELSEGWQDGQLCVCNTGRAATRSRAFCVSGSFYIEFF